MEVKEVAVVSPEVRKLEDPAVKGQDNRAALSSLVASSLPSHENAVRVSVPGNSSARSAELRKKLNEAIEHVNVAEEATSKLSDLVRSIGGIVEQASSQGTSSERRDVLQREGNDLLSEIRRTALTESIKGVRPLAGDEIRVEIEEKLGRVLDAVLPDDAKNAFGIAPIDFSTKETIINTVTQVKEAELQLAKLRDAVNKASMSVQDVAVEVDVAIQNTEASQASVRDVDQALKLAQTARRDIGDNPEAAVDVAGDLGERALGLLK